TTMSQPLTALRSSSRVSMFVSSQERAMFDIKNISYRYVPVKRINRLFAWTYKNRQHLYRRIIVPLRSDGSLPVGQ
ncbi:MAG: hypothetical protein Q7R41_19935, partial [Phycisphaerales bacterium]|nr:hypothetical protein [Phycisphaerales bacterium]